MYTVARVFLLAFVLGLDLAGAAPPLPPRRTIRTIPPAHPTVIPLLLPESDTGGHADSVSPRTPVLTPAPRTEPVLAPLTRSQPHLTLAPEPMIATTNKPLLEPLAPAPSAPTRNPAAAAARLETVSRVLKAAIVGAIPLSHEDNDDWGKTENKLRGVKMRLKGGKLDLDRRDKAVNHGTWKKVAVSVPNPQNDIQVRLTYFIQENSGKIAFQLHLIIKVRVIATIQEWRNGVKLFGATVDTFAEVETWLNGAIFISWSTDVLPTVSFAPHLLSCKIHLKDIDMNRIGRVDGKIAENIGDKMRKHVEKRLKFHEGTVAREGNKALQKLIDSGKLRFAPRETLSSLPSLSTLWGGKK